jgi:hypothetical protein
VAGDVAAATPAGSAIRSWWPATVHQASSGRLRIFPRSARQRCLAHRMRNLAVKVPADQWPEFKAVIDMAERI